MTSTIVTHTTTYNHLDLPQQETVGSTIVIDRKYDADGTKLQEKVTTNSNSVLTRDYIGNLIYENGTLKKILFDGGYVDMTGSAPAYRFYLTDHLGSVRVVAAADGTVMQVNHYYPYGGLMIDPRHTISSTNASDSRYRFTGKELSEESGEYDFGARFLDPIPGRFTTIDPLAEKYYSLSPYAYCAGNPMSFVDPDGTFISTHTDYDGNVIFVRDDGGNGVYRHSGNRFQARRQVLSQYSLANTSAGGEYMGESLHSLSFADMNRYHETGSVKEARNMRIMFNDQSLTRDIERVMASNPGIYGYAKNARAKGIWDLKSNHQTGSLLFGKYASPRDAGNFLAGMFSASKGIVSGIIDYGYGVYNASGNSIPKSAGMVLFSIASPLPGFFIMYNYFKNEGEDELSKKVQLLGEEYYKQNY